METVNEMLEHPICSYSDMQQNKYVLSAVKYNSVRGVYQMQNNVFIKYVSGSTVWKK